MSDISVNVILDRYERDRLPMLKRRTQTDYKRHLAVLRRHFGSKVASELTLADLTDFMQVPRGKIQRNRQIAVLSAAFAEAVGWKWLQWNICKEVTRNASKRRNRQLTDQEFAALRQLARPRNRAVMDLALYTGQLQGQIITLRWAQVDDDVIRFRHPRTGKKVEVPITAKIAQTLVECGRGRPKRGEYVITTRKGFPYTSEGFRACWQRVMKRWRAGGNDAITFHDIHAKWVRDNPKAPNGEVASSLGASATEGQIVIAPRVFRVPKASQSRDAVAVMMQMSPAFNRVYEAIRDACEETGFKCQRADDIWQESTIIQDIFNLIHRSHVVIVDFTGKNGNVLYETGIAHALGRHVVPISQDLEDVPFDIKHHRVLKYSGGTDEGLTQLSQTLAARLRFIGD
jgi:integrase